MIKLFLTFTFLAAIWQTFTSCAIIGAVASKTVGDPPEPAQYVLPKVPTLVVVENFNHPSDLQGPSDQLAELITRQIDLLKLTPMIEESKLIEFRTNKPREFEQLKIIELGAALGAQQVIYVDLKQCDVYRNVGSDALQARVEAYVKVVDVATGRTQFPTAGEGLPFKVSSDFTPQEASDTPLAMRNELIDQLSASIVQLFFEVKKH